MCNTVFLYTRSVQYVRIYSYTYSTVIANGTTTGTTNIAISAYSSYTLTSEYVTNNQSNQVTTTFITISTLKSLTIKIKLKLHI